MVLDMQCSLHLKGPFDTVKDVRRQPKDVLHKKVESGRGDVAIVHTTISRGCQMYCMLDVVNAFNMICKMST